MRSCPTLRGLRYPRATVAQSSRRSPLGSKEARVLGLVMSARQGEARGEAGHVIIEGRACGGDDAGNTLAQAFQQALTGNLAERDAFDRRRRLRFEPGPDIPDQRVIAIDLEAAGGN